MTARFVRPFNVVGLAEMSDASKAGIFETILGTFLSGFTPAIAKLTEGLVASTIDTFNTVVASLLPTPAKSHYTFNLRDLAKVFQGTLMGSPKMILEPVGMVRLWVHELKRVFEDRLTTTQDHDWFRSQLETCCAQKFSMKWSEIQRTERLMYCDFTDPTADPRIYSEVEDIDKLKLVVNDFLEEHNAESKSPMPLVMFLDAIEHVLRIARILRQPQGNALLLGVGGSGRQSMSKMATYISGYELFQVEIAKGYGMPEWREDLRKCLLGAGVKDQQTAFIFTDAQVVMEAMLEDVNNILNAGDVPNLYGPEELDAIMSACRVDCQKKQITPTKTNIFAQYIVRVRRNMHVCLCMSPLGETFRERLRQFPSLVNCSTIDWFTEWPAEALESVGLSALVEANQVKPENRQGVVKMFKQIHQDVRRGVRRSGFNLRDASLPRIDGVRDSLFINTGRGEIQGVLRGAAKVQLCDTYVLLGIIIFVRFSPRVQTRRSRDQKEPVEDRSGQDHQYRRTGRRHAKRVRDLSPPTHRKRQGSGRDDGRH
jgi:dynein heavy chain